MRGWVGGLGCWLLMISGLGKKKNPQIRLAMIFFSLFFKSHSQSASLNGSSVTYNMHIHFFWNCNCWINLTRATGNWKSNLRQETCPKKFSKWTYHKCLVGTDGCFTATRAPPLSRNQILCSSSKIWTDIHRHWYQKHSDKGYKIMSHFQKSWVKFR